MIFDDGGEQEINVAILLSAFNRRKYIVDQLERRLAIIRERTWFAGQHESSRQLPRQGASRFVRLPRDVLRCQMATRHQ